MGLGNYLLTFLAFLTIGILSFDTNTHTYLVQILTLHPESWKPLFGRDWAEGITAPTWQVHTHSTKWWGPVWGTNFRAWSSLSCSESQPFPAPYHGAARGCQRVSRMEITSSKRENKSILSLVSLKPVVSNWDLSTDSGGTKMSLWTFCLHWPKVSSFPRWLLV